MNERILTTLRALRQSALEKGADATFLIHEENSYLMRFANSAISLNTNEHLVRLEITAYDGKKRASYGMITDLNQLNAMREGLDTAIAMVAHAMPLDYQPTVPVYTETFIDESGYDLALAQLSNAEKLAYFNAAVAHLETDDIRLSGIFSCGANIMAMIGTRSEHLQYFASTDAQVSIVLAHATLKWEVTAEQSAWRKEDLNPAALHRDLALLLDHYHHDTPQQIPLGAYDVVFGPAAIAEMVSFMGWIGFNGGLMKRGFSFLSEEQIGQKIFSDQITLQDDPGRLETYPFKRDFLGLPRRSFSLFEKGIFQAFTWYQDDADEFGAPASGHTVPHTSLSLAGGRQEVATLAELLALPREKDLLYIPFLHYMNIVNPSKALVTGTSRFGALLLKADGSVVVPYNVRLTQSLLEIFGEKVAWASRQTLPYNTSQSYGARNPTAVVVPAFLLVRDLEISHSNSSY